MQIVTEKRNASVAGMQAQREFTVKVGAHIMTVLSGLYKNPIDAMVREYTTNMYDAWLALKKQNPNATYTPCELHLPTALSPFLVFKDYGVGMSFDTVWSVYSQYGNSTKSDSNDEVGGFGLGSKTAFCYNNGQQWTIESRYNGEIMTFMAFVGEDGIPNITHVATVPTTEQNGVTIRIPIRREHVQDVHKAAQRYVPYFPMEITVINSDRPITKPEYTVVGNGYGISPATRQGWGRGYGRLRIVMGNVPYDVDSTTASRFLRELVDNNIDLTVPIGAVDIVPSRDDLKYTDRTAEGIAYAVAAMVADLSRVMNDMVDSASTEWEAIKQFQNIDTINGLRQVVKQLTWKGRTIDISVGVLRTASELQKIDPTADINCYGITSTSRATVDSFAVAKLIPGERHYLMIDDMAKGGVNMAKGYCFTHLVNRNPATGRAYRYGHSVGHVVLVKTKLTKKQISDFFGGFPEDLILTASSVSGKVKIPAGVKGNDALYRFDGGKTWGARVNVPTGGPFFYLELVQNQHSKRWMPESYDADDVRQLLNMAREFNIVVPVLYGIKKGEVATFDAATWKPLLPAIKTAAQTVIDRDKLKSVRFHRGISREHDTMMKIIEVVGMVDDVIIDFSTEYKLLREAQCDVDLMNCIKGRSSALNLGLEWPATTTNIVPSISKLYDAVITRFPMFGVLVGVSKTANHYGYPNRDNPFQYHKNTIVDYMVNQVKPRKTGA